MGNVSDWVTIPAVSVKTDDIDDGVGIIPPAGRLVVAGQIHGDRLMPS